MVGLRVRQESATSSTTWTRIDNVYARAACKLRKRLAQKSVNNADQNSDNINRILLKITN